LAGGIRRAALISLFSADDEEMIAAKAGAWWELNPQRGRANNSVVVMRHKIDKSTFMDLWTRVEESRSGEPGFYFSNDKEWGCNPCCEIGLRPNQFCNLVEINVSDVQTQEELNERSIAASFIGTLQASYTDFHYLRPIWKRTTEKEALIGVSMTGIASGGVLKLNLKEASLKVNMENRRVAMQIGINPAARTTCVKPAGTTSLALGTSSGIHAWHNDYYIRRLRVGKNEAIYNYLMKNIPELVEDCKFRGHDTAILSIPQKAPEGAILRHETAFDLLERVKKVSEEWIQGGHHKGSNSHNVSATITIKDDEWDETGKWMWENRGCYNGLSVLPHDGGTYVQAPFEDCDEETYEKMLALVKNINLDLVIETEDETDLSGEIACGGGACEIF
jgi:ribonucleoside-triphosphate reductase